jgi:hypothetical protein
MIRKPVSKRPPVAVSSSALKGRGVAANPRALWLAFPSRRGRHKSACQILGSLVYHNHPIGQALVDQIRITSEDLKLVKVLEPSTDPKAFAERITVNLLA